MDEPRYCCFAGCVCVVCCQIEDACSICELRLENVCIEKGYKEGTE